VSSLAAVALLAAGIVFVVGGAQAFFDGFDAAAARLRISAFVVTTLVSGFELENLAAGIAANAKGLPDAAAGTFLFLCAAVSPLPLLALDGRLTRLDGGLLVAWLALATAGVAHAGRSLLAGDGAHRKGFPLVRLLAGLGLLLAGGELLGDGIRRAVTHLGASEALLGNTVVAAPVEAEEVGRVAVPARRGRGDVALGNISGTLVHFLALNGRHRARAAARARRRHARTAPARRRRCDRARRRAHGASVRPRPPASLRPARPLRGVRRGGDRLLPVGR
jgi:cation:H+ antiporter